MKLAAICVAPTELGGFGRWIYYKHVAPSGAPVLQRQVFNRAKPSHKWEGPRGCRFLAWVRRRRGSISAAICDRGATQPRILSGHIAEPQSRHRGTKAVHSSFSCPVPSLLYL
jgi:hypothetical protein